MDIIGGKMNKKRFIIKCPITKKRPNINDCVKHCNGPCDMLKNLSKHLEDNKND